MSDTSGGAPAQAPTSAPAAPTQPAAPAAAPASPSFSAGFRQTLRARDQAAQKAGAKAHQASQQPAAEPQPPATPTDPAQEAAPAPEPPEAKTATIDDAAALKRWRDLEQALDLPADLMDKVVEVPVKGGAPEYRTVRELIAGNLRLTDYSREMNQTKRERAAYQQYEQQRERYFKAIQDPDFLLEDLEARGYGDTALKLATKIAERVHQQRAIVAAAGHAAGQAEVDRMVNQYGWANNDPRLDQVYQQAYEPARQRAEQQLQAQQKEAAELRRLRQRTKELEAAQQQVTTKEDSRQYSQETNRSLDQLLPKAFKVYGLDPKNPVHRQKHLRHMMEYLEVTPAADRPKHLTKELVLIGAQMVKEELEATQRREQVGAAASKLPVQRLGSIGGPPQGVPGQPQSLPVSGMRAALRARDGR